MKALGGLVSLELFHSKDIASYCIVHQDELRTLIIIIAFNNEATLSSLYGLSPCPFLALRSPDHGCYCCYCLHYCPPLLLLYQPRALPWGTGSHLFFDKEEELAFINPVSREVFPTQREPLDLTSGFLLLLLRSIVPGHVRQPVCAVILQHLVDHHLDPSLDFVA